MRPVFCDPGALNSRFVLEQRVEAPDGCGGTDVMWTPVANLWGEIWPYRAIAFDRADQSDEELTHTITCRYRTDIASGWRLTMDERTFNIITVHDPDELQNLIQLSGG